MPLASPPQPAPRQPSALEARHAAEARASVSAAIVLAAIITVLDITLDSVTVAGLLVVPPIVTVPRAPRRSTVFVSLLCVLIAAASGIWDHNIGDERWILRVIIVAASGGAAVWAVMVREKVQRSATALAVDNAVLHAESQRSRTLLDTLVEHAPIGVAFLDSGLRLRTINQTLAAYQGRTVSELVGIELHEAFPRLAAAAGALMSDVFKTGEPTVEVEIVGPPGEDGAPRHFLTSYYRIEGPEGPLGIGLLVQEVTDQVRSRDETERQRSLYETLLRAQSDAGQGFALLDGAAILYVNDATSRILGYTPEQFSAMPTYTDVLREDERAVVMGWLAEVMAGDGAEATMETVGRHADGRDVELEISAQAVAGVPGVASSDALIVVVGRDITERKQAERDRGELLAAAQSGRQELEASHRRLSVLARAGAVLERSLDLDETLPQIAELIVDEVADSCTIEVLSADRRMEQVAHAGETRTPRAAVLAGAAGAGAADEPAAAVSSRLLTLPLLAGRSVVGSMSVGHRRLSDEDDQLVRELVRRVALAVANARLYAERDHVAGTLQRSLLPPGLPDIPGYELAAAFRPAGTGNEVGGDFYDAFRLADQQWGLVIGDVCGKGADAAAVTALARYSIRTITAHEHTPSRVLAQLNDTLLRHGNRERFCTAAFAVVDERASGRITLSIGGHPAPAVVRADGQAEQPEVLGTLLGVVPEPVLVDADIELEPGDALVFVTDGIMEAQLGEGRTIGTDGLLAALASVAGAPVQRIADHLADLAQDVPGGQRDDIAVLVLRRRRAAS